MSEERFRCRHQVIDLSRDGRNNQGRGVHLACDILFDPRITINGVTILSGHPTLNLYFEQQIIGGRAVFVEIAKD
ncbi:MAG: hypothetical protein CMM47_09805 [Rhodospirillaceae bacterium]|nr:hypothetical protein [Rhodospirillaceae bacterium]